MNSRDAAYEEEQLRRAIEESKREGGPASTATGIRKGKRSRSESEEYVSVPLLPVFCQSDGQLKRFLLRIGAPKIQSGSEPLQVLQPRIRKAKVVAKRSNLKTKPRSQNGPRIYGARQLETTEIKKSGTGKPRERKNAQMQVEGNGAQNESETKVNTPSQGCPILCSSSSYFNRK